MTRESFPQHNRQEVYGGESKIEISEKSRRLGAILNMMARIVVTGGMLYGAAIAGSELGTSYIKSRERREVIAQAGEPGGKLFDRLGHFYHDDLGFRIKRHQLPESHELMHIEPIETHNGIISTEVLKNIITKTYPRGWFQNSVHSIKRGYFKDDHISHMRDPKNWKILAVNDRGEGKKTSSIVFNHEESQKADKQSLIENALFHESCHAVENLLPVADANNLFEAIANRVEASDRFQSTYVENIETNKKKETMFYKVQEYWAEICSQFFQDPTRLHVKDFLIVSEQITKVDPAFNWKIASQKRKDLIHEKVKNLYAKNKSKNRS